MFYQKILATITQINKNIAKAQPKLQRQVAANQPRYYTSISMIARTKAQKLIWWSCKHNGTCKIK